MLDVGLVGLLRPEQLTWILLAALLVVHAGIEWLRFYSVSDPRPVPASIIAVLGIVTAVFMTRRGLSNRPNKSAQRIHDNERAVATALERLAAKGWHVFHKIRVKACDVDHVAIGPTGIYAISARPLGQLDSRPSRVVWDRSGVSISGATASTEIVDRATALASELAESLKESTGESLRIRPVVLFPNCTVEQKRPRKTNDPWVLGTQGFLKLVGRSPVLLDDAQIERASFALWRMSETNR